ncbi:hypothetical protein RRG08_028894 [Elysia crispata]|uniref:Uncharacterized protein n=1 Tax=Elysia crispata TaxID=231223 RepID=A0AAE1A2Z8_9GAST|nr:hypothetical protein RRG08_028894 [Elysia crispata]
MLYATLLLAVAATVLSPPARTLSPSCKSLKACTREIKYGSKGTWSTMFMVQPVSQQAWNTQLNLTCADTYNRTSCFRNSSCRAKLVYEEAKVANALASWICTAQGRDFYQKVYNGNYPCEGNSTLLSLWRSKNKDCKIAGTNNITDHMPVSEICTIVNTTRTCSIDAAVEVCNNATAWVVGSMWTVRIKTLYPECSNCTWT